jgi:hypothetical protein
MGRCAWWEDTLTIAPGLSLARKRRIAVAQPVTASPRLRAMSSSTSLAGASVQRGVSEDRGVVDPAGKPTGLIRGVGGPRRDALITGITHHGADFLDGLVGVLANRIAQRVLQPFDRLALVPYELGERLAIAHCPADVGRV